MHYGTHIKVVEITTRGRGPIMTNKRIQLPKDQVVGPGPRTGSDDLIDVSGDVEGHGFFPNPAPPADFSKRTPSQGGEAIPTDTDPAGPDHLR
jgi:hypothetical protein